VRSYPFARASAEIRNTVDYPKPNAWLARFESAFVESNPKKLIESVEVAEAAIDARLFALRNDSDHHEERQQINDAQRTLRILRRNEEALEVRVKGRTANLKKSEESLRRLTGRLLSTRDDERRRLSLELHDSVGQLLTAITMDIALVQKESERLSPKAAHAAFETADLTQQVLREIRTISHLLHPPLLDECGLLPAIRWYAEGFERRSNIKVTLELDEDLGRLPRDLETTAFRVLQECLTNIHRHSNSKTARIRIVRSPKEMRLEVRDEGRGIPAERIANMRLQSGSIGVGTSGMRERIRQFGGELEIDSQGSLGTVVTASIPLQETSVRRADDDRISIRFWAKLLRLMGLKTC
jgi:signal transduction histidine kinase